MNNTLESYKIFPYVAWTLVIGFALFTYSLTMRLEAELSDISSGIERLETRLDQMDTAPQTNSTAQ